MRTPLKRRPTVVLADDHPATLHAVSQLMRQDHDVVAEVNDGVQAVEAVASFSPDLAVLDITMPRRDGFDAARCIRDLALPTRIIFLTITEDWDYAMTASTLGASYVLKRRLTSDLIAAVHETLAGRLFLSPLIVTNTNT